MVHIEERERYLADPCEAGGQALQSRVTKRCARELTAERPFKFIISGWTDMGRELRCFGASDVRSCRDTLVACYALNISSNLNAS
ncbi:hypothetical protein PsYK624_077080 [Phanerochaete sordida]|uniref:Uncharacterized protein n=1 Tax=Phanerochaete sordida TaxID=48140 RepID=A0A9P3LEI7_9APHY|nr:hypothetical protein PsYK624_077080 [Phanerochaete sordida]